MCAERSAVSFPGVEVLSMETTSLFSFFLSRVPFVIVEEMQVETVPSQKDRRQKDRETQRKKERKKERKNAGRGLALCSAWTIYALQTYALQTSALQVRCVGVARPWGSRGRLLLDF